MSDEGEQEATEVPEGPPAGYVPGAEVIEQSVVDGVVTPTPDEVLLASKEGAEAAPTEEDA